MSHTMSFSLSPKVMICAAAALTLTTQIAVNSGPSRSGGHDQALTRGGARQPKFGEYARDEVVEFTLTVSGLEKIEDFDELEPVLEGVLKSFLDVKVDQVSVSLAEYDPGTKVSTFFLYYELFCCGGNGCIGGEWECAKGVCEKLSSMSPRQLLRSGTPRCENYVQAKNFNIVNGNILLEYCNQISFIGVQSCGGLN